MQLLATKYPPKKKHVYTESNQDAASLHPKVIKKAVKEFSQQNFHEISFSFCYNILTNNCATIFILTGGNTLRISKTHSRDGLALIFSKILLLKLRKTYFLQIF